MRSIHFGKSNQTCHKVSKDFWREAGVRAQPPTAGSNVLRFQSLLCVALFFISPLSERSILPFSFFEDFSRSPLPLKLRDFAGLLLLLLLDFFGGPFSLLSRLLLTDFFFLSLDLLRGRFLERLLFFFRLLRYLLRLTDSFLLPLRLHDFFCCPLLLAK